MYHSDNIISITLHTTFLSLLAIILFPPTAHLFSANLTPNYLNFLQLPQISSHYQTTSTNLTITSSPSPLHPPHHLQHHFKLHHISTTPLDHLPQVSYAKIGAHCYYCLIDYIPLLNDYRPEGEVILFYIAVICENLIMVVLPMKVRPIQVMSSPMSMSYVLTTHTLHVVM